MLTNEKVKLEDILGSPISREEAYAIIASSPNALELFNQLEAEYQEEILAFVQGIKGLPILYDGFYKYVMDPEIHPERLESFLSDLLKQKVKIEQVIPREGIHLAEAGTFVVMDIIVRLENGSIVDVELQKQGYLFPGERSDCYQADMIMRQYNRVKKEKGKKFKYTDIKPVYLIILMEKSTKEFKAVSPNFIHRVIHTVDSGAKINFLSNLVYISLDTFRLVSQNISSNTEAWLTFLSSDKPEDILRLVEKYPEFKECYRDIMMFRKKPEELIGMFSKALYEMDRNTEKYMVRELQEELDATKLVVAERDNQIAEQSNQLAEKDNQLAEQSKKIQALYEELQALKENK